MPQRNVLVLATLLVTASCGGDGGGGVTEPGNRGTINGQVSGPGGAVPNAVVVLSGGGQQQTNDDGQFSFVNVEAGAKTLTLTPPDGFELAGGETAAKSTTLAAGGTANLSWSVRLSSSIPRTVEVGLTATTFNSDDVAVPVGSTVRWTNQTAITHTISPGSPSQAGTWGEVTISGQGTLFSHTFGTAGTFEYICKLHAGMNGVVRVH